MVCGFEALKVAKFTIIVNLVKMPFNAKFARRLKRTIFAVHVALEICKRLKLSRFRPGSNTEIDVRYGKSPKSYEKRQSCNFTLVTISVIITIFIEVTLTNFVPFLRKKAKKLWKKPIWVKVIELILFDWQEK